MQEVVGRVRGAGGQPPGHLVQFGQQAAALVRVRAAGLPGQGQPAQQAGDGGRVEARDQRNEWHRGRGVPLQAGLIAEDGGSVRVTEMSKKMCQRVAGVPVGGNRLTGRGRAFAEQHTSQPPVGVEHLVGLLVAGTAHKGHRRLRLGEVAVQ